MGWNNSSSIDDMRRDLSDGDIDAFIGQGQYNPQLALNAAIIKQERIAQAQQAQNNHVAENLASTDPQKLGMNVNAGMTDAQGRMIQPKFQTLLDSTGQMKAPFLLNAQPDAKYNSDWLTSAKAQGMSTEQSPWAKLKTQQLNLQKQDAMDQAAHASTAGRAGVGAAQGAQFKGSQGARERVAMAQSNPYAGVGSQYAAGVGDIGAQDQTRKNTLVGMSAKGDTQVANAAINNRDYKGEVQKFNIDNALNDIASRRATDTANYNENMKAWAALNSADATASSKPSGKK